MSDVEQNSADLGKNWKVDFFTVWTGQAISLLGSMLVQFALIWHLTVEHQSATILATASLVGLLPHVFLSPFVGALVDRWNRRAIMIAADTVIALATIILAVLFAVDVVELWHIFLLMFIRAVGGGFHGPAMMASTSMMVPKEHLTRIQGINQMLNGGLNIVSAPLGALMLELLPMQGILGLDVGTAVLAILPLFLVAIPQPLLRDPSFSEGSGPLAVLNDMKVGLKYVVSWKGLLILLVMATLINFILTPAFSLMPLLVKGHYGGGAIQLGWLNAGFGFGVIAGGLFLSIWGGFKRRILTSVMGLIGMGLGIVILGITPSSGIMIALGAMILCGIMQPITNGPLLAIIQAAVDPEIQGRVFTLVGSAASGMSPIGLAIAGPLADIMGTQSWFIIGGGMCILMAVVSVISPDVMNIEKGRVPAQREVAPNSQG